MSQLIYSKENITTTKTKASSRKAATFNPATNPADNELAVLAQRLLASKAKAVRLEPVPVDKAVHTAIQAVAKAEHGAVHADGKRYPAFKAMLLIALPLMADMRQHTAIVLDVRKELEAKGLQSVATQINTILNNARKIACGCAATRDTAAQPAQGVDTVISALNASSTMKTLKAALAALKPVPHKSQGKPAGNTKQVGGKVPASAPIKADDVAIPSTRAEAIKAACRILEFMSTTFPAAGSDAELIGDVEHVVDSLKRKAA